MFRAKLHMPLIFSMFCPGAGQLIQRRWIVGLLFLIAAISLCISLAAVVLGMMSTNMDAAMAFVDGEPNKEFAKDTTQTILRLLAAMVAVYFAGLVDTYRVFKKRIELNTRQQLNISE